MNVPCHSTASLFLAYAYVDSALYWFMLLLRRFSRVWLCDPRDGSPLGSSVPGILQARILEWVATSFSNAWKGKVKVKSLSHAWLLATPWTAAFQAPPSMGFSRQEYWSGVPLPSPSISLGPLFRLFWKDFFFFKFLMQLDFPSFYLDFLHLFLYIDK